MSVFAAQDDVEQTGTRVGEPAYARLPAEAVCHLGRYELAAVRREARRLATVYRQAPLSDRSLLTNIEVAAGRLPDWLLSQLIEFRTGGNRHGTLLLRNLPVDFLLPPTPLGAGAEPPWQELAESTVVQLSIMSVLGEAISYTDQRDGRLVQDVHAAPGAEAGREDAGGTLPDLRTENGLHPFKPEYLSFYCLRSDHERRAATVTASARSVLDRLPGDVVATLRQPAYSLHSPSSGDAGAAGHTPAAPVLSGPLEDPDLCVDFRAGRATTARGARALQLLHDAMRGALVGAVLEPGDMILVDNRVAVHGHTGFTPWHDGRDRWLRRCFGVSDLRPSRSLRARGSRVCEPFA